MSENWSLVRGRNFFERAFASHIFSGLSKENKKLLVENVNFFFHIAATVKFDDPLRSAIITNTRGTREACYLALQMKKIQV